MDRRVVGLILVSLLFLTLGFFIGFSLKLHGFVIAPISESFEGDVVDFTDSIDGSVDSFALTGDGAVLHFDYPSGEKIGIKANPRAGYYSVECLVDNSFVGIVDISSESEKNYTIPIGCSEDLQIRVMYFAELEGEVNESGESNVDVNETIGEGNETLIEVNETAEDVNGTAEVIDEVNETIEEVLEEINETEEEETETLPPTQVDGEEEEVVEVEAPVTGEITAGIDGEFYEIVVYEGDVEAEMEIDVIEEEEVTTRQYKAVIGRPVKWMKAVKVNKSGGVVVEIPKVAEEVVVKSNVSVEEALIDVEEFEVEVEEEDREQIAILGITGNVVLNIKSSKGFFTRFHNSIVMFNFLNVGKNLAKALDKIDISFVTGNVVGAPSGGVLKEGNVLEDSETKVVDLSDLDEGEEVVVEYVTEAPEASEVEIEGGKRVTITGPDEVHYEDVLAYSLLDNVVSMDEQVKIRLYWYNESVKELVSFDSYDLDGDGFVDYIEWNVPHLSEQVYEIIYITKAEHLDVNRNFVLDIYSEVSERDGVWSGVIAEGEYVRVTFEKNLTNVNDITIYARAYGDPPTHPSVEVYTEDGDEVLATFLNISEDKKYRILLTELVGEEDVFDLKILNSGVEFDYIVDPPANDSSNNVYRCGTLDVSGVYQLNQSITNNALTTACINITAENVTLDCDNLFIKSDDAVAGVYSNQLNTTIQNCVINMSDAAGGYGIHFENANNSLIKNSTLLNQSYGLYLINADNVTIYNNIIVGNALDGAYIEGSNNNLTLNNLYDEGDSNYNPNDRDGISIIGSNNTLLSNIISGSGNIDINITGDYNILTNNDLGGSDTEGEAVIHILGSNNVLSGNRVGDNNDLDDVGSTNGIYIVGSDNTLKSNTIEMINQIGVYIIGSNNNLTLNTIGDSNEANSAIRNHGIYLLGNNNTLDSNKNYYTASGNPPLIYAMFVNGSDNTLRNNFAEGSNSFIYIGGNNNNLTNNSANNNDFMGIWVNGSNNILTNNNIRDITNGVDDPSSCTIIGNCSALYIENGIDNVVTDSFFDGGLFGIYIHNSSGTNITNANLTSNIYSDVYLINGSVNNIFTNASYGNETIADGSELIRKWYYRAYVNDTNGDAVGGYRIEFYHSNGSLVETLITNASGWAVGEMIDYVNSGGTKTYYSNYTINTYLPGYNRTVNETYSVYNATLQENIEDWMNVNFTGDVIDCGYILVANETYTLQNDVSSSGTCINVAVNNITLDGNGYLINYSQDGEYGNYGGVYIDGYNNTIVRNVSFEDGGDLSYRFAFYISNANNLTISNVTIDDTGSAGIFQVASTSSNITLFDSTFNTFNGIYIGSGSEGIYLHDTNISYNNFTFSGSEQFDIFGDRNNISSNNINGVVGPSNELIHLEGDNNSFYSNNITQVGSSNGFGGGTVYLTDGTGNRFYGNRITAGDNHALDTAGGSDNEFYDNIFFADADVIYSIGVDINYLFSGGSINTDTGSGHGLQITCSSNALFKDLTIHTSLAPFYLTDLGCGVTNFSAVNVTYSNNDSEKIEVVLEGVKFNRKWYYQAYVNDSAGNAVSGADVRIYAISAINTLVLNLTTNASGWTSKGEIIDYVYNDNVKTYYSNYSIVAFNTTASDVNIHNVTLEENIIGDVFTILVDTTAPVISGTSISVSWNSATFEWTVSEPGNASVKHGGDLNLGSESVLSHASNPSITLSSLIPETLYYYNFTSCDVIGNCVEEGPYSFITPAAPTTTGGSGSSYLYYVASGADLENGIMRFLKEGRTVSLNFPHLGVHVLKVDEVTNTTSTITISSTPVTATLVIGETREFDLDGDGVDDLSVTLESILDGVAGLRINGLNFPEEVEVVGGEGNVSGLPVTSTAVGCEADYVCGDFGECEISYTFADLLKGVEQIKGKKRALCEDSNRCGASYYNVTECVLALDIYAEEKIWCGDEFVWIYEKSSDELLVRIKDYRSREEPLLNIDFLGGNVGYCGYCFDGVLNGDEIGVDCGGSCEECVAEEGYELSWFDRVMGVLGF